MLNICIFPRLLCILSTLTLASCTTNGAKPTNPAVVAKFGSINPAEMATVVIFRESNYLVLL